MSLRDKYLKWETWQFGPTPSDATVLATQLNWMFRSALLGFAVVSVAIILYLRNISANLGPETKESEYAADTPVKRDGSANQPFALVCACGAQQPKDS